jgi:hypothetical protein
MGKGRKEADERLKVRGSEGVKVNVTYDVNGEEER